MRDPREARLGGYLHVVLVHPEIHWNTGNAGRTCLAAGATLHLIEPLTVARESAGCALHAWQFIA
jgi:tRNA (cytidine/uridine-2'-O-)-methyltransferase